MKTSVRSVVAVGCLLAGLTPRPAPAAAPETGTCPAIARAIKANDVDGLAAELAKKPKDLNTACIGTGPQAETPLVLVVSRFDNEIARKLSGKDATIEDFNRRMEQMLTALVKAGADVNRRAPEDQLTPLLLAVMSESPGAVMALLTAGADPNVKFRNGKSALAIAQEGAPDTAAIVVMLKGAGAKE